MEYPHQVLQSVLERTGCSNFNVQTIRIPLLRFPEGAWEKLLVENFITQLMGTSKTAMTNPIHGLSMSLLTRLLPNPPNGWSEERVRQLCGEVWEALNGGLRKDTPVYYNLYVACHQTVDRAGD